ARSLRRRTRSGVRLRGGDEPRVLRRRRRHGARRDAAAAGQAERSRGPGRGRKGRRASEPTPTSPESFGKYTLVERIAAGGMATVWKAKLAGVAGFEKTFALKRILPHLAEDEGFV